MVGKIIETANGGAGTAIFRAGMGAVIGLILWQVWGTPATIATLATEIKSHIAHANWVLSDHSGRIQSLEKDGHQ
ncbi:MAG: hypothetical protein HQ513_05570 [Rhodospirillales bacterium]|nr:hypothetical protein [Rhodospirillales bacterium]